MPFRDHRAVFISPKCLNKDYWVRFLTAVWHLPFMLWSPCYDYRMLILNLAYHSIISVPSLNHPTPRTITKSQHCVCFSSDEKMHYMNVKNTDNQTREQKCGMQSGAKHSMARKWEALFDIAVISAVKCQQQQPQAVFPESLLEYKISINRRCDSESIWRIGVML